MISLSEARTELFEKVGKGEETYCPCCGQHLQPKECKLSSKSAATLFLLYRAFRVEACVDVDVFVDQFTEDFGKTLMKGRGCKLLTYWGLLHPLGSTERIRLAHRAAFPDGKKNPNVYQLTQRGYQFVFDNLGLPQKVITLDDRVVGWPDSKFVTCIDLVKRRHEELLATEVPTVGRFL